MPRLRLTDITVRSLPFSKVQTTYWDDTLPAFGVRVGARRKTFIVIKNGGRRFKLGTYPDTKLQDARQEARRRLLDPRTQSMRPRAPTAAAAAAQFIELHHADSSPRWRKEQERLLGTHFLARHEHTPLDRISAKDILAITDGLRHLPSECLHAHRALKTFFKWAAQREMIEASPLANLPLPTKQTERDRVLSDDEIVRIYKAAQELGYPFGYIVLICIHTAMRRGEVAALKWSYITPDAITLPADATKNGVQHVLPNLINDNLALIPKRHDYLFPTSAGTPFSAWGKNKTQFDALCGVTGWTLHDIRRTVRTKLAEWECCSSEIAERVLGHVTAQSRVARIYNRWQHFPQMKAALNAYETKLAALIAAH